MKTLLLSSFVSLMIIFLGKQIFAQNVVGKVGDSYRVKLNKINLPITSTGILADVNIPPDGTLGRYNNNYFLYSGGFAIGGYANDALWVRGQFTAALIEHFISGKVNEENNAENQLYVLKSSEKPFSKSWLDWVDAVKLGAKFYDGDNNGIYEPIDKNKNSAWDLNEDMPDILGDLTVWCVYNDGVPTGRIQNEPQGIEIAQTIFGSTSQQYLKNILFIRYSITNRGTVADVFDSVYFTIWNEPALGYEPQKNKSGCDQIYDMSYAYQDSADISGLVPPFLFISFLQGPEIYTGNVNQTSKNHFGTLIGKKEKSGFSNIHLSSFHSSPDIEMHQNPLIDLHYYNLMKGLNISGDPFIPCEFSPFSTFFNVSCDTLDPTLRYAGDPFVPYGWLMKRGTDIRMLTNIGPFRLIKDIPQEIIVAYSIGSSQESSANAFYNGKTSVMIAKSEWEDNFSGLSYTHITQNPEPKIWKYYHLAQNYPNPFNLNTQISYEIPRSEFVKLKVYDFLGQEILTLVSQEQEAGGYELVFDGGNLSSGVYFYRIDAGGFFETRKMTLLK